MSTVSILRRVYLCCQNSDFDTTAKGVQPYQFEPYASGSDGNDNDEDTAEAADDQASGLHSALNTCRGVLDPGRDVLDRSSPLLTLLTAQSLEQMVCGTAEVSIDILRKVVRYRGMDENHVLIKWFWTILEDFTNEERIQFLRFISGRTRLPSNPANITQRFQIMTSDRGMDSLPTSQTCFFQLSLPMYSSVQVMAERLRYAIHHCRSIDMDNYMLTRNAEGPLDSDMELME